MAGNPLAELNWYLGERFLRSNYYTEDNYATAEIEFTPRPSDNGKELRCEATSPALAQTAVISVPLSVRFAPEAVKIRMTPDRAREGRELTITCETGVSRPPATVTWWHNGERLENAESVVTMAPGGFDGSITTSKLTLRPTAQHDGAVVTCEARNPDLMDRTHDAVTLAVLREFVKKVFFCFAAATFLCFFFFQIPFDRCQAESEEILELFFLPSSRRLNFAATNKIRFSAVSHDAEAKNFKMRKKMRPWDKFDLRLSVF